jgi:fructose-1,6-bisphosphatase II
MPVKLWPRDDSDRKKLVKEGFEEELSKVFYAEVLARGDGIIFRATGISDSPLLTEVRFVGHTAVTHSILVRAMTGIVRHIQAGHDLTMKTIRLRSTRRERTL